VPEGTDPGDYLSRKAYMSALRDFLKIAKVIRVDAVTAITPDYGVYFCDTTGGTFAVTLPAGIDGAHYKIINTGVAGEILTVTPQAGEGLFGAGLGVSSILSDGEVIDIHFESAEGWW